jgi:protein-arginine deiminase
MGVVVAMLAPHAACTGIEEVDQESTDGDVKADDPETARSWRGVPDVFGVPNLDDDDENGVADWAQGPFAADDDVAPLVFPASVFSSGKKLVLSVTGTMPKAVRIRRGVNVVLGAGAPAATLTLASAQSGSLLVEFAEFNIRATLVVKEVDAQGAVVDSGTIALNASPLILNHHLQPAERLFALSVSQPGFDNQAFVNAYASVLGSRFTKIPGASYGLDVWVQDEFEFGTATAPGGRRLDVVLDSIRDRGLDDFPEEALVGPGSIARTWGQSFSATTFDSFGNLEATPPVTAGGVSYPFGRIYYGRKGIDGLDGVLASFLKAQKVQAPIELDTTWLCVGHVDEIISFVPDKSSAKGFKMLFSDVRSALAILGTLPANRALPQYQFDHGYATVGQLRGDANLIAMNEDIQSDHLDPIKQQLKTALGLTDSDIILVPSLFERLSGCRAGEMVAMIPGMVNLIVANPAGENGKLFVPDPFFRSNLSDQSSDPFISAFAASMPEDLELHFVDNWDVYHVNLGEVHCGTNVIRTPNASWWNGGN